MKRFPYWQSAAVLAVTLGLAAAWWFVIDPVADSQEVAPLASGGSQEPIQPIPVPTGLNPERVALGEALFKERMLSADNSIACVDCHSLSKGGTDGRSNSVGIRAQEGEINAPSVFNAALNFVQFWDGRATTLEEQAAGPVHNPIEMGSNWPQVIGKLRNSENYRQAFAKAYRDGITPTNITNAIATFERSLLTPDSRFDAWLKGNGGALNTDEQAGDRLFKSLGCVSCHQGVNVGGNMYQKFGIFAEFRPAGRALRQSDMGRFNVTGKDEDRAVFKVPSLRNVALTAPYFHDGSAPNLETAVSTMARVQLGRDISREEIRLLIAFLHSLTGQYQGKPL